MQFEPGIRQQVRLAKSKSNRVTKEINCKELNIQNPMRIITSIDNVYNRSVSVMQFTKIAYVLRGYLL